MGLQTWTNAPDGKVLKRDVGIAKNYLNEQAIGELNRIVNMYLDYAENQAKRHKVMKMEDWVVRLDAFLAFNDYNILTNAGKASKALAENHAGSEYEKFRVIQDREFISDFDRAVLEIKATGELPKEELPPMKPENEPADSTLKANRKGPPSPKGKEKK